MDIATFVWEFPPNIVGGLGTYAKYITLEFIKKKHHPIVFTYNKQNKLPKYQYLNGIDVHRPLLVDLSSILYITSEELKRWGDLSLINDIYSYNILSTAKFINQIRYEENIDVVAIHDWLSGIAGLCIKDMVDIPVIFHIHSTEELRSNLSSLIKNIEHELGKKADRIITVSYAMKKHLVSLGYDENKIRVVWNGIDTTIYSPKNINKCLYEEYIEKYGLKNKRVVLFIGRLTSIKGIIPLIEAFKILSHKREDVKLIIIGKGEEENKVRCLITQYNLKEKVILVNRWLSEEEKITHLALADICVFPSYQEPFGIVALEAMAMKKPVLVSNSNISGFVEQVVPGENGDYISPYNIEEMAAKIEEYLSKDIEKIGENARMRVIENFSIEQTAEKTIEIYKEVL